MTTCKTFLSTAGLAFCLAAAPQPASARDFVGYASTDPLLYLYAACVFEKNDGTAGEQIERCVEVKTTALETAPQVIELFHVRNRSGVLREFKKGMAEIEKDAQQLRNKSKPVPARMVTYLRCMGQNAMAQPDYLSGDAVSYIGIEGQCAALAFNIDEDSVSDREMDAIDALYRRFRRSGRLTYPVTSSAPALRTAPGFRGPEQRGSRVNRLSPATRYTRSFLDLSNIRKEKPADD